jgi:hypothetical protein
LILKGIVVKGGVRRLCPITFGKKNIKIIGVKYSFPYLCNPKTGIREFSSAGSEHLPYKQRVGGSNPSTPTPQKVSVLLEPFVIYSWF